MNVNIVIVAGRLTRDPELKALPSGGSVATFSLAINRTWTQDGVRKEAVEFANIVVFGKTADTCAQWLKKGQIAHVEGRLQTRSWESEGETKYRTEIVGDQVQFGPRAGDASKRAQDESDTKYGAEPGSRAKRTSGKEPAAKSAHPSGEIQYPDEDINPDDIPF